MQGTKWLACSASAGQFRDEAAVRAQDYAAKELSLFTSRAFVHSEQDLPADSEIPAHLQVALLEQRDNLCLILLPAQTFDNGATLTVRADQLAECPTPEYA